MYKVTSGGCKGHGLNSTVQQCLSHFFLRTGFRTRPNDFASVGSGLSAISVSNPGSQSLPPPPQKMIRPRKAFRVLGRAWLKCPRKTGSRQQGRGNPNNKASTNGNSGFNYLFSPEFGFYKNMQNSEKCMCVWGVGTVNWTPPARGGGDGACALSPARVWQPFGHSQAL